MIVLAGDVGGTNARLALARSRGGRLVEVLARVQVPVAEHEGLEGPLQAFLGAQDQVPAVACLGVAGQVEEDDTIRGVNMPWGVSARSIERACGIERVVLVNDFYAAARGVEQVGEGERVWLSGEGVRGEGPQAVLGAGTGLGEAFLVWTGSDWSVVSTEGGHRGFAPANARQEGLLRWLRGLHGRVSTERVLSGPGLVSIYRYLVEEEGVPTGVGEEVEGGGGAVISARRGEDAACREAVEVFVDVYGQEAGDVALTVCASGGVFVVGEIAGSLLGDEELRGRFRAGLLGKGRHGDMLGGYPVELITSRDLGLLGAAGEGVRLLGA